MTQTKRQSLREKVDAARKKTTAAYKSPEFVDDSDLEDEEEAEEAAVESAEEIEVEQDEEVESETESGNEESDAETESEKAAEVAEIDEFEVPVVVPEIVDKPTLENATFLWSYRDRTQSSTHTSLIGGSYVVPLEKRTTFYEKYFSEFVRWLNTNPTPEPNLFLTERYNGEYFRFFIDLDYQWTDSPPAILETVDRLTRSMRFLLGFLDTSAYDHRLEVRPSGRTNYKRHVVFPQVIVDSTNALLFAQGIEKHVNNCSDVKLSFDMKVYRKGSLRMLGSCKRSGVVPGDVKETEFFYMPVDVATGERKKTITYEEFSRHSILLDRETTERAQRFAAIEDGKVCLPGDESYSDVLYVTPKFIHKDPGVRRTSPRVYESTYTGPREVSVDSPLHKCLHDLFGAEVADATGQITHDPTWNSLHIPIDKTTFCPLIGRQHTSNHAFITLSKRGIRAMCWSTNEEICRNGGEWTPLTDLPQEVVDLLPIDANAGGDDMLHAALDGTHVSLAKFFVRRFEGKYMAAQGKDQKNLSWFAFVSPVWKTNLAYSMLINDIVDLIPEFEELARRLKEEEGAAAENDKDSFSKVVLMTAKKLKTNAFKSDVVKEMSHMVSLTLDNSSTDLPFIDRLNVFQNKHLLAFRNGVYDLRTHTFRDGLPSDYFSFTTGYNFYPIPDAEKIDALRLHYERVQPEPDVRKFMLKTMSTTLDGYVKEQKIYVWYGAKGEGAKSTTSDMHAATLGDFGCKMKSSYLVQEEQSSESVTNTLVLTRGRRLAVAEEFKQGATLNDAVCKQVTATTNVVRGNFESQKNVDNTTTVFAHTNQELRSHSGDQAINRRIEHITFTSRFVDNPDPNNPREFKKDRDFTEKFLADDGWKLANFHILLDHYKMYQEEGLQPIPEAVANFRERFEAMSNPVGVWLKTGIVRKNGSNAGLAEMKRCYSAWYFNAFDVEPNTKNFQDSLQQNSIMVEVLRKKSCTSWVSQYDQALGKTVRVKRRVSTQPAALDVELVDEVGEDFIEPPPPNM